MPLPWLIALRAIPWVTILSQAPAIARAADRLLSGVEGRATPKNELRSLSDRVTALERDGQADVELLKQVTDQVQGLTMATEVIAARLRWLLVLGVGACLLAIMAIATAFLRR